MQNGEISYQKKTSSRRKIPKLASAAFHLQGFVWFFFVYACFILHGMCILQTSCISRDLGLYLRVQVECFAIGSFKNHFTRQFFFYTNRTFCKLLAFREKGGCRAETPLGVSNPCDIFFKKRKSLDLSKSPWQFLVARRSRSIDKKTYRLQNT